MITLMLCQPGQAKLHHHSKSCDYGIGSATTLCRRHMHAYHPARPPAQTGGICMLLALNIDMLGMMSQFSGSRPFHMNSLHWVSGAFSGLDAHLSGCIEAHAGSC